MRTKTDARYVCFLHPRVMALWGYLASPVEATDLSADGGQNFPMMTYITPVFPPFYKLPPCKQWVICRCLKLSNCWQEPRSFCPHPPSGCWRSNRITHRPKYNRSEEDGEMLFECQVVRIEKVENIKCGVSVSSHLYEEPLWLRVRMEFHIPTYAQ